MNSRERVLGALNFRATDRIPKDLGAMRSTGISAFAYPKLVEALGLPPRRPRINDINQMLALPEPDVLDALSCDVVTVEGGVTNAFHQAEIWRDYDFNGRLAASVPDPGIYRVEPGGAITFGGGARRMPPTSYVFDADHGGQPMLDFDKPLPLMDLKKYGRELEAGALKGEDVERLAGLFRRVRESTDRAVLVAGYFASRLGIGNFGGLAVFPVICLEEPDYVRELHEITIRHVIRDAQALLPRIKDCVDVVLTSADDWGTQQRTIASPETYRKLFMPYYRRLNDEIHKLAPGAKTFMHNCGAIYDILDMLVESGFDVINPVQWTAGGKRFQDWKDKLRGRAAAWGGGVGTQTTLTHGTVEDVKREVREVCAYFKQGGGFVFNNIHNLLAETPPEKILAMYRTAGEF